MCKSLTVLWVRDDYCLQKSPVNISTPIPVVADLGCEFRIELVHDLQIRHRCIVFLCLQAPSELGDIDLIKADGFTVDASDRFNNVREHFVLFYIKLESYSLIFSGLSATRQQRMQNVYTCERNFRGPHRSGGSTTCSSREKGEASMTSD